MGYGLKTGSCTGTHSSKPAEDQMPKTKTISKQNYKGEARCCTQKYDEMIRREKVIAFTAGFSSWLIAVDTVQYFISYGCKNKSSINQMQFKQMLNEDVLFA